MKRVLIRIPITVITFWVGVCAVSFFWGPLTSPTRSPSIATQINAPETSERPGPIVPQMSVIDPPSQPNETPRFRSRRADASIAENDGFEQIVSCLKKLPAFMRRPEKQTFYISAAKDSEDGRFTYAYWEEYDALIVFQLPFSGDAEHVGTMNWLSDKAYIDLKLDVVPKMRVGTPLYKVPKAWANKIVRSCKAGYKLKVTKSDRLN
jgi:hypothetical protein